MPHPSHFVRRVGLRLCNGHECRIPRANPHDNRPFFPHNLHLMQASREEAILVLKKWRSASVDIRCSVIHDPDFQVSLSLRVLSVDDVGVILAGPNDNRVLIDLTRAEFEFLDSLGISHPGFAEVAERYVDSILGIFFRDIALNFILAARK